MDFINLNESAKTGIRISQSITQEYYNAKYSAAHLLKALLHKEVGSRDFIRSMDKDLGYLEEWAEMRIDDFPKAGIIVDIQPDGTIPSVIEEADRVRLKLGLFEINPICLLAALARPNIAFTTDWLKSFPLRENEIFDLYVSGKETIRSIGATNTINAFVTSGENGAMPMVNLMKYCIDKTA